MKITKHIGDVTKQESRIVETETQEERDACLTAASKECGAWNGRKICGKSPAKEIHSLDPILLFSAYRTAMIETADGFLYASWLCSDHYPKNEGDTESIIKDMDPELWKSQQVQYLEFFRLNSSNTH